MVTTWPFGEDLSAQSGLCRKPKLFITEMCCVLTHTLKTSSHFCSSQTVKTLAYHHSVSSLEMNLHDEWPDLVMWLEKSRVTETLRCYHSVCHRQCTVLRKQAFQSVEGKLGMTDCFMKYTAWLRHCALVLVLAGWLLCGVCALECGPIEASVSCLVLVTRLWRRGCGGVWGTFKLICTRCVCQCVSTPAVWRFSSARLAVPHHIIFCNLRVPLAHSEQ